jgi:threonine/homoserine/homoserine lactone efflux protein
VKLAGAAYLGFIGIRMLLSQPHADVGRGKIADGAISLRRVCWQGALTNLLNPKVALFFLAFLPQFVAAESPHKALAFLVLGLIFICNGTLWCLGVAAFAARTAHRVRRSGKVLLWINRALGGTFVYFGARIALLQAR